MSRTLASADPHQRLEQFLTLPGAEQDAYFHQLAGVELEERILDGDLEEGYFRHLGEWRPQRPPKALKRGAAGHSLRRSVREARTSDALEQIAPPDYWEALTGDPVPGDGLVRCPLPGHEDVHPSCLVYPDPGAGWFCFVCDKGGSAIDLAEVITGIESRGRGYLRLRQWIANQLLNTPTEATRRAA